MTKVRNAVLNRGCVKLQRKREVMLCADTCLQNQLKNRGQSRIKKWCGEREDCSLTLFFTTPVTDVLTLWWADCYFCVCVKTVSCITPLGACSWMNYLHFFFPACWISCFQHTSSSLHMSPLLCFLCVVQNGMEPRLVQRLMQYCTFLTFFHLPSADNRM